MELPDIGSYCSYSSCRKLGYIIIFHLNAYIAIKNFGHFLYLLITKFNTFSNNHKNEKNHDCKEALEAFKLKNINIVPTLKKKSSPKNLIDYWDKNLDPLKPKNNGSSETKRSFKNNIKFSKLWHWIFKCSHSSQKSKSTHITILKLKKEAKGETSIPLSSRLYIKVEFSCSNAHFLSQKFFYISKDWSCGRSLDYLSKNIGIKNVNSSTKNENERLHLMHIESGKILEPSKIIGDCIITGDTVVLMRGINYHKKI
ncbi:hypothetical protein PNEG_03562 [Pneumocystis murina B123]|uniref:ZFAND1-like ubiquitin-like domain-containing protein n=1 Tax=Pneumocystis murina (strain B123) TaxID=1069680 RepID=M7PCC2_PNEMU|nr:hypothetical protein PNEG_03562 [Pneumocystis murina B123]EMR08124.1 hypothetical protein PNEG_03562 [Pneumocystis murina B123]